MRQIFVNTVNLRSLVIGHASVPNVWLLINFLEGTVKIFADAASSANLGGKVVMK